mmetsp:Transcript_76315/g.220498  ORF Transcript_76315/g.220498 Transcript_76315/m.220498 type:complete len:515 (-) Transcript_76315:301-1845(-)
MQWLPFNMGHFAACLKREHHGIDGDAPMFFEDCPAPELPDLDRYIAARPEKAQAQAVLLPRVEPHEDAVAGVPQKSVEQKAGPKVTASTALISQLRESSFDSVSDSADQQTVQTRSVSDGDLFSPRRASRSSDAMAAAPDGLVLDAPPHVARRVVHVPSPKKPRGLAQASGFAATSPLGAPPALMEATVVPRRGRRRAAPRLETYTAMSKKAPASAVCSTCSASPSSRSAASGATAASSRSSSSSPPREIRRRATDAGRFFQARLVADVAVARIGARAEAPNAQCFRDAARLIAKDVPRTFTGNAAVDQVRLRIADVLRGHAALDPELGYVQGMCFPAAGACLNSGSLAEAEAHFQALLSTLRPLWLPGFPLVEQGLPLLEELFFERDPELFQHLLGVGLDLAMVIPSAWLSCLAKWLPIHTFMELLPFISREGILGLIAPTLLLLLFHREDLIQRSDMEDIFDLLTSMPCMAPPDRLLEMCEASLPSLRPNLLQRAQRVGGELAISALRVPSS